MWKEGENSVLIFISFLNFTLNELLIASGLAGIAMDSQ